MVRRGIATNETISEVLKNAGTPLAYDASPEAWREAFTIISGSDETIAPRETEGVIGWKSTDETASKTFNNDSVNRLKFKLVMGKERNKVDSFSVQLKEENAFENDCANYPFLSNFFNVKSIELDESDAEYPFYNLTLGLNEDVVLLEDAFDNLPWLTEGVERFIHIDSLGDITVHKELYDPKSDKWVFEVGEDSTWYFEQVK